MAGTMKSSHTFMIFAQETFDFPHSFSQFSLVIEGLPFSPPVREAPIRALVVRRA